MPYWGLRLIQRRYFNTFKSRAFACVGEVYVGGNATMVLGYDDKNRMFLVRNSWSPKWGIDGYCWIPYDYLTNPDLAADFWAIQAVAA
jgi:C1A family cysteine protease